MSKYNKADNRYGRPEYHSDFQRMMQGQMIAKAVKRTNRILEHLEKEIKLLQIPNRCKLLVFLKLVISINK